MTTPIDELQLRTATAEDFPAIWAVLEEAFGQDMAEDVAGLDRVVFEPERDLVFVDGDTIVANAGAYTRELTVPGAIVPGAHVTLVSVRPTYHRRGLLTRLMHRQLRDIREAGEPVALLWASEGRIYQRFGYGLASYRLNLEIDSREVALLPRVLAGEGRLRSAPPGDVRKELIGLYDRLRAQRTGWSSRDSRWWDKTLGDPASQRHGATVLRAVVFEAAEDVEGYALWRTKADWDEGGPRGKVHVREVVTASPRAYTALWRFLLSVDLTRSVDYWAAATDEPLLHLVNEPRRLGAQLGDALWVRVVDLPAALTARRYAAPLDTVIEVNDSLLVENSGRWRLRTTGSGWDSTTGAQLNCEPTDEPAEVSCEIADLGAVYLGGTTLAALAAGGRVRELRPGALALASAAFGWYRQPSTLEVF
jgi:predicted acetyltransferase